PVEPGMDRTVDSRRECDPEVPDASVPEGARDVDVDGDTRPGATATDVDAAAAPAPKAATYSGPRFVDVAMPAGVTYAQMVGAPACPGMTPDAGDRRTVCTDGPHFTGGAAAADYDRDGFIDLFVTRQGAPAILYRNNRDGTFTDVTASAG